MGPIWGRQDPGGPHVGPMDFTSCAVMENHVISWIPGRKPNAPMHQFNFAFFQSTNTLGLVYKFINCAQGVFKLLKFILHATENKTWNLVGQPQICGILFWQQNPRYNVFGTYRPGNIWRYYAEKTFKCIFFLWFFFMGIISTLIVAMTLVFKFHIRWHD